MAYEVPEVKVNLFNDELKKGRFCYPSIPEFR